MSGDYELLYLETLRPDRQTLVALRSRDLVRWTRHDAIVYDLARGEPFIVFPAAIVGDDGRTHLFYVDNLAMTTAITTLVSADGMTWDPAMASRVAGSTPSSRTRTCTSRRARSGHVELPGGAAPGLHRPGARRRLAVPQHRPRLGRSAGGLVLDAARVNE